MAAASGSAGGTALPNGRGWRGTRTGLYLRPDLSFDDWRRLGRHVGLVRDATAWWIGDWLIFGQSAYGRRYKEAIVATGLDYQTLRNYAWVASRFHVSRRRDNLSFGHHAEVAAFCEEDQDAWLRRAALEAWSRRELRRRLRAARALGLSPLGRDVRIELTVTCQRQERWQAAASAEGRTLEEWIEGVLDLAADSVFDVRAPLAAA